MTIMEELDFKQKIYNSLNEVIDPELGIGIVDLGLIYDVVIFEKENKVVIDMTLTTPNCPMSEYLSGMAGEKLRIDFYDQRVDINVVWEPAWTPEKISENGKKILGMI